MFTMRSSATATLGAAGLAFMMMMPFTWNYQKYGGAGNQIQAIARTGQVTGEALQIWFPRTTNYQEAKLLVGDILEQQIENQEMIREAKQEAVLQAKEETQRILEERERAAQEAARLEAERLEAEAKRQAVISCSEQDYEVLKRIVQAEAGGCDIMGRILVANVVMNRVKNGNFPNNVTGVVYQKSQFSPVHNGSINTCVVTSETIEAVDRALSGEDYSQGALYFMNRSASYSHNVRWFDGKLTYLFQHGGHEFFR